jgi:uncharacterized membrane protein (UPF0127 family)
MRATAAPPLDARTPSAATVPAAIELLNRTTKERVAMHAELAVTRRTRRRGLLGRNRLESGTALVLVPCVAVHTAFMKFAIDVVFVNRLGSVVHVVERLQPWRAAMAPGAYAVIELAAGSLARHDVRVGDRLCLVRPGREGANEEFEFEQVQACLDAGAH